MTERAGALAIRFFGSRAEYDRIDAETVNPDNDMVLEAALNGPADAIVSFNADDFEGAVSELGADRSIHEAGRIWVVLC
jgi:hypothetical protein